MFYLYACCFVFRFYVVILFSFLPKEHVLGIRGKITCVSLCASCHRSLFLLFAENVENNGFEPLTPCLQSRCSSQLS